jgi:MFS family permease
MRPLALAIRLRVWFNGLDERNSPPTSARYTLLIFLGSLAFILYLDRVCIGKAEVSIRGELGLSKTQMGFVFGAFTIAYGLFEVVTGRWGDRYGSRGVLTRIVIWWSVFTALTGAVPKFAGHRTFLAVARRGRICHPTPAGQFRC